MVKKLIICAFLLVLVYSGYSQSKPDTLIDTNAPDCENIAYNSTNLIMYFYAIQDYDSLEIVLNDWESACGISEPIVRTKILFSIFKNAFSETIYDSTIVDYTLNYLLRMDTTSTDDFYHNNQAYFGYVPLRGAYDFFTQTLADSLLNREFYHPMELYFSEMYANVFNDPLVEFQHDTIYNNTAFWAYYYKQVDKYRYKPDVNVNIFSGIWIPNGNASLLGNHPYIGFQGGVRFHKMTYNISLAIKFLKSKNEYEILRNGNIETSRHFFGGYFGADLEREIFKIRKNEFDLLGGIGFDGFDAINVNTEDDDPDNDKSHSINSVNINFGLGYRHYFANKTYFSLQGKYNLIDYNNYGGTNLSGNCLTISLMVGGFPDQAKDYFLKELRYVE